MALAPGFRLGPSEVTALIGSGGMGEVSQPRDTKLDRDVALKVLPEHVATDPELLRGCCRRSFTILTDPEVISCGKHSANGPRSP